MNSKKNSLMTKTSNDYSFGVFIICYCLKNSKYINRLIYKLCYFTQFFNIINFDIFGCTLIANKL